MLSDGILERGPIRRLPALKARQDDGPSPERPHWRVEHPRPGYFRVIADHGPYHPNLENWSVIPGAHDPLILKLEGEVILEDMLREIATAGAARAAGDACPCGDCH